ncbi:MAG TPA: IclR family transcriptional regulator [Solirubrobacteraceae bacterium]|jgi:IclR family pca regulon transcriptional regulator
MTKPLDPEHPGRFSSSLCAGLAMLTCFTPEHPVRGIADMADALDLGRSTTHRYATTLVTLGYLEQGPSRKYRLSSRVSDFGLSLLDSMVVRRLAREHLRELRARTGHTVGLAILDDSEVSYVDRWQGSRRGQYAIDLGVGLGSRLPIHCSAAGKALLAHLPEAERRELIAKLRLTRRTAKTITTKSALRAALESILADDGLAVEDEELLVGRRALAAPVFDEHGRPIAAVELAVPESAYTTKQLVEQLGPLVLATSERITSALS